MEIAPLYTDKPDEPFGTTGLASWMSPRPARVDPVAGGFRQPYRSAAFLSVCAHRLRGRVADRLVADAGTFVGFLRLIGALQIVNLWLGLYSAPKEWPWTYFFLFLAAHFRGSLLWAQSWH